MLIKLNERCTVLVSVCSTDTEKMRICGFSASDGDAGSRYENGSLSLLGVAVSQCVCVESEAVYCAVKWQL